MKRTRRWLAGSLIFVAFYFITFATVAWGLSAPLIAQLTGVAVGCAATGIAFPANAADD